MDSASTFTQRIRYALSLFCLFWILYILVVCCVIVYLRDECDCVKKKSSKKDVVFIFFLFFYFLDMGIFVLKYVEQLLNMSYKTLLTRSFMQ